MNALNADVVGYSRLMADDAQATSRSMAHARRLVAEVVSRHGGALVNFVGDNFMAVFEAATDAVQAAIDISLGLEETNASVPPARWLQFRMGLARGAVTAAEDDYEGEALNVAARIQAMARPGGLSVSGDVYRALDEPALRFRPVGRRRLKNIPEPVEVYDFAALPTGGTNDAGARLKLAIPSLAVLPLQTTGLDPAAEAAFSVLRDDLVHRLSAIPELQVLDTAADALPPAAARYLLEAHVHQSGQQLRVNVVLVDVTTMNVVKAQRASGTMTRLLELSDDLSERVGRTVEIELVVGAPAGLYAELGDPEAIQNVYTGWYHLRTNTQQGWTQALSLFDAVASAHPRLPHGWVLSAFANWMGASNGWAADKSRTLGMARDQARRANALGDPTGMAQAVEAAVLMSMGRVDEAMAAAEGLEITRPTCDVTFGLEGSLNRYIGRWERAVDLMGTAMALTAVNKPWYPTVMACSLLIGNKPDQAASIAESVLENQPNNIEALLVLAASQHQLGLRRRAKATARTIQSQFPSLDVEAWLDSQPYQDPHLIDRWKSDLASLDLMPT